MELEIGEGTDWGELYSALLASEQEVAEVLQMPFMGSRQSLAGSERSSNVSGQQGAWLHGAKNAPASQWLARHQAETSVGGGLRAMHGRASFDSIDLITGRMTESDGQQRNSYYALHGHQANPMARPVRRSLGPHDYSSMAEDEFFAKLHMGQSPASEKSPSRSDLNLIDQRTRLSRYSHVCSFTRRARSSSFRTGP